MKNIVKSRFFTVALGLLSAVGPVLAQSPSSGHIRYEATQRTDMSKVRIVVNGQVIKPGSPDFPTDIPESRSFGLTLSFAGNYAREERENAGPVIRMMEREAGGAGGAPQNMSISRPFEEATYLNLVGRAATAVLTVKDAAGAATTYRSDAPIAAPVGWTLTSQTKKIAGYLCRKATVSYKKENYTVWFTTDLPFTYSPVRELTPERGVVLALESEQEQFQAAKIDFKPVAEAEVRPATGAQPLTLAELQDRREKALADFRQRLMEDRRN